MPEAKGKVRFFIQAYSREYSVRRLCKVMQLHPSGYYAWLKDPISTSDKANSVLLEQIKEVMNKAIKSMAIVT